jgi:hypothetical protein
MLIVCTGEAPQRHVSEVFQTTAVQVTHFHSPELATSLHNGACSVAVDVRHNAVVLSNGCDVRPSVHHRKLVRVLRIFEQCTPIIDAAGLLLEVDALVLKQQHGFLTRGLKQRRVGQMPRLEHEHNESGQQQRSKCTAKHKRILQQSQMQAHPVAAANRSSSDSDDTFCSAYICSRSKQTVRRFPHCRRIRECVGCRSIVPGMRRRWCSQWSHCLLLETSDSFAEPGMSFSGKLQKRPPSVPWRTEAVPQPQQKHVH